MDAGLSGLERAPSFAIVFESGKRQPTGEVLDQLLSLGPIQVIPAQNERIGDAAVVAID